MVTNLAREEGMTKIAACLLTSALIVVAAAVPFAEEKPVPKAPFTLAYRARLANGGAVPPGRYSARLDGPGNILVFDAEGEDLLYTLKPFMVDRLSRPVADVRVVVEEGPGRPTYVRVYAGRRAAYFREFQDAPSGCCD